MSLFSAYRIVTAAILCAAGLGHAQSTKRVAVMNFDYATVQSGVSAIFGSNQDVGKGIADLLVDKLVSGGTYRVIERKVLDKVLGEQNFSNSDRADATTAAKIGRVLGVDAIIVGSITQFGRDDKKTSVAGDAMGRLSRYGLGGVSRKESKAVVAVTARMVDTSTGEILASVTGRGESTRSGTNLLGAGGSGKAAVGGSVNMQDSNFANSILGEAVRISVNSVAQQLEGKSGALPARTLTISGLVADAAADGTLILNIGSTAGVKVGDRLSVKRLGRKVADPVTGKTLRQLEDTIGVVTITEVEPQSAVGTFSGSGKPQMGDPVKNQ